MSEAVWHEHEDGERLARELASAIAGRLDQGIAARGHAVLVVSGGTTPQKLFRHLSQQTLDWDRVSITLADERLVPPADPRSNEGMVRRLLLSGPAARAGFVPLFSPETDPGAAAEIAGRRIAALPVPFDVVVLGMGLDGHTASIFPDAPPGLTDPSSPHPVLPVHSGHAPEPRLTLTLAWLVRAHHIFVHIEGEAKRRILRQCLAGAPRLPIGEVIRHARQPVHIHWAPTGEVS